MTDEPYMDQATELAEALGWRRPLNYILAPDDPATPIPAETLVWARWFEDQQPGRIVAQTRHRDYAVSTVFLGIDHSFFSGPPILWETMVFWSADRLRGRSSRRLRKRMDAYLGRKNTASQRHYRPERKLDGWQDRYATYAAALRGHSDAVKMVRSLYG